MNDDDSRRPFSFSHKSFDNVSFEIYATLFEFSYFMNFSHQINICRVTQFRECSELFIATFEIPQLATHVK